MLTHAHTNPTVVISTKKLVESKNKKNIQNQNALKILPALTTLKPKAYCLNYTKKAE
jgi:hypothetical protein